MIRAASSTLWVFTYPKDYDNTTLALKPSSPCVARCLCPIYREWQFPTQCMYHLE